MTPQKSHSFQYDIALSFAGEDRAIAEKIANELEKNGISVFYDKFEEDKLWGKNIYDYLADIYSNHAEYCIMLISAHYANKSWTNHERQNAQARAFRENKEYILPIRLDETQIPGIPETIGYIDYPKNSVATILEMVKKKLGKFNQGEDTSNAASSEFNIPMPKIKQKYTQLEKDRFLKDTFLFTKEYFKKALQMLRSQNDGIEADIDEITSQKFICKVYSSGSRILQCKVWIGGFGATDAIVFSDSNLDVADDSSHNDMLSLSDDESTLGFGSSGMWFIGQQPFPDKDVLTKEETAEYLWLRFTHHLQDL